MTNDYVIQRLAPCGLDCSRCADFVGGNISLHAAKLLELLGNYGRLARLKSAMNPDFSHYGEFESLLRYFSGAKCGGCRSDDCHCPVNCHVKTCHKENSVDFCFECSQFPCEQKFFSDNLRERWLNNNNRMKEIGSIGFYEEQSKLPRY